MAKKNKKEAESPLYEWDKLPQENMKMYARFTWYRDSVYTTDENGEMVVDISRRRSYKATAIQFNCSTHNIEIAGKKYRWKERCEAYDAHIALKVRQENDKKVMRMLNNHAVLGAAMVQRAAKRLISLPEDNISAAETIKMADVGVKIERMSRGIGREKT